MVDKDKKRRAEIITSLLAAYGQASDGERIAEYVKTFRNIPPELLEAVCEKLKIQSNFVPSIAEIVDGLRSLIGSANEKQRVKPWNEAQAEIAKGISRTWFRGCLGEIPPDHPDYGQACEPMWSTPEIKAAVDSYGMDNLALVLAKDMPVVWAQLRKAYESACASKQDKAVNAYILGARSEKLSEIVGGLSDKMMLE
mgnify:CR=1 FL=1